MADDKDFTEYQCELNSEQALGAGNKIVLGEQLLNPDYVPPIDRHPSSLEIRIYYTRALYKDFSPHWTNKNPLIIEENEGIINDLLNFTIEDASFLTSNLPFDIQPGMRIELCESDGYCKFKGTIKEVVPDVFMQRPTELTDIRYLRITAKDYSDAMSKNPVTEAYQAVTESFMLSDQIGRYCEPLSNLDIDTNMGETVGRYVVMLKFTSQEAQAAMLRNDWVMWINREGLRVQLRRRDDSLALAPIVVTDSNVWNLFDIGSLRHNQIEASYNNRVIMPYLPAWRDGTVDVEKSSYIVYGDLATDFSQIKPGYTFRMEGSTSTYSVDHVNIGPREIYLTSQFQEADVTAGAFVVTAPQTETVQLDDIEAQEALAELHGETGELAGVRTYIAPQPAEPMTEDEAEIVASMYLRTQVYEGEAKTDSIKFPYRIQAGQALQFNRYNFNGTLVFRRIRWRYQQSLKQLPVWKLDISFTDPIVDIDRQIRALLHERHRAKLQNDLKIKEKKYLRERVLTGSCVQAVDPRQATSQANPSDSLVFTEPDEMDFSQTDASDAYSTQETPAGPFYTSPAGPGHTEATVTGFTGFSRTV